MQMPELKQHAIAARSLEAEVRPVKCRSLRYFVYRRLVLGGGARGVDAAKSSGRCQLVS